MADPVLFDNVPTPDEHVKKHKKDADLYGDISAKVSGIASRTRLLEDRYSTLRKKSQLTDQNLLRAEQELTNTIKEFTEEMRTIKVQVQELREKANEMAGELSKAAKENDVRELATYARFSRLREENI